MPPMSPETKSEAPKKPLVFSKFTSALAAHKENIPIPAGTDKVDYEVELVAVIGKKAYCVSPEEALEHVAGYTIGNDVTARPAKRISAMGAGEIT